jgi:hypothetical protein
VPIKQGEGMAGCFRALLVLILMVTMGEPSLQAADHPNFSGFWTLDLKAQQATSMNAVLEAHGVSMLKRKLMDTMSMTQDITQTGKTLTIKFSAALLDDQTHVLILDGKTHILDIEKLGKIAVRSFWDKDGKTIVTVMKSAAPGNEKSVWTTRRHLQDAGRTMIVDHLISFNDGRKVTGKRVFRKP